MMLSARFAAMLPIHAARWLMFAAFCRGAICRATEGLLRDAMRQFMLTRYICALCFYDSGEARCCGVLLPLIDIRYGEAHNARYGAYERVVMSSAVVCFFAVHFSRRCYGLHTRASALYGLEVSEPCPRDARRYLYARLC